MSADDIDEVIAAHIATSGPISIADYIGIANARYYGTRDPIGTAGDFVTAPEISQMFGEIIGLVMAHMWQRAGCPGGVAMVELGPGHGTLAADARRVMARAGCALPLHLVETSRPLRERQARSVGEASWHDDIDSLPACPLLVIANEFFDALPVRQLIRTDAGWRERCLTIDEGRFIPVPGIDDVSDAVPASLRAHAPLGAIVERHETGEAIMARLAAHIARHGGGTIVIDYGYQGPAIGDTVQAVSRHAYADPFVDAGARDLTTHVDFAALSAVAQDAGLMASAVTTQGNWLRACGIDARANALIHANAARAADISAARARLVGADEMGDIFKCLGVHHRDWPDFAGFPR